jgi:hypothetical protein
MTVEQLMTYEDAYVFSTVNGDATLSTEGANRTVISAVYNSGLYTYQMEEKAYVVFYVKCGDDIFCGPMKERTIKEAINEINKSLPVYKQMRELEIRDTEFEKTTTRKIKRFLVK